MKLKAIRDVIKRITDIDIFEQSRRREVIEMRSVANVYLRRVTNLSYLSIVEEYNKHNYNTTHSSIIHSVKSFYSNVKYNPDLELFVKALSGDSRLFVLEKVKKATDQQIELIEEILMH